MVKMQLVPVLIILLFVCGGIWAPLMNFSSEPASVDLVDSAGEKIEYDVDSGEVLGWMPPVIPTCVKQLLKDSDWSADTICVVDGKAYYLAHDGYYRTSVIYSEDGIIVSNPVLLIDSFAPGSKEKFYVSVVGKTVTANFSDKRSINKLASLSQVLPGFCRYRHDTIADFGKTVLYSFAVDFPTSKVKNAGAITKWLVKLVERSQSAEESLPVPSALYIGYNKRMNDGLIYRGEINDSEQIGRFAVSHYFAIKKGEYGDIDEDYPSTLFADLNLQAVVYNKRYVTYQEYTHDYNAGMHGFYTERLVSYDHVHRQEIDCVYLFKPERMKDVLLILIEEAMKTPQYNEWEPNIMEYVANKDEDGNQTGGFTLPTPGLSEDGIVFSFQPYAISCFAAGTFHFTIPYRRIKHCLTKRARWCVGQN